MILRFWILACVVTLSACGGGDSGSAVDLVSVTVSGKIRYEDKEYGVSGFTGNTMFLPVRYATVDIVDEDGIVVATTNTDEAGDYQLQGTGANLYIRVLADTGSGAGASISVMDFSGGIYSITNPLQQSDGIQDVDLDIGVANSISGAYNMLDVFTSASQFIDSLSTVAMPAFNAYWQSASSSYGTYFCPGNAVGGACPQGKGVYILGGSAFGGDTDQYDDDVLWHEYSHFMESALNILDSPGGVHYLTDNDIDLRLSWSEGLSGFFPSAVKTWLAANNPGLLSTASGMPVSQFVDTYGSVAGISVDMGNPPSFYCPGGIDCFIYSSSEVSVAKVLSQLNATFGMQAVWDVYSSYMPSATSLPSSIETFWDGWISQRAPGASELVQLESIFNDRFIYFQEDSFESDDVENVLRKLTVCTSSTCNGEIHQFYHADGSADSDYIAFDVDSGETYTVQTFDLSNGADTYLRIVDVAGNVILNQSGQALINDDRSGTVYCYSGENPCKVHNDDIMLSSSMTFLAAQQTTYYAEVSTSAFKPTVAGRYGRYSIRVIKE
jgi:hypothetical protein